jgi:hypothetical protein
MATRFDFLDRETADDASVLLRHLGDGIGLAITTRKGGDIEVILWTQDYLGLMTAMESLAASLR